MAHRLALDARRAKIIAQTREMIAKNGPEGLSLRAVARWCGMSAPGILHHFDGMRPLLEAVIAQRDAEELAAATDFVKSFGDKGTLRDFADGLVRYQSVRPVETQNFNALESEAMALPTHPARDYYLHQIPRPFQIAVELAQRDYTDPVTVLSVLGVVADGLRLRWLRSETFPDYWGDWVEIRDRIFAGFAPLHVPEPPRTT